MRKNLKQIVKDKIHNGKKELRILGLTGLIGASSFFLGCSTTVQNYFNGYRNQNNRASYEFFTASYYKDLNKNGLAEKNEFIGRGKRFFHENEPILFVLDEYGKWIDGEKIEYEIYNPKGGIIKSRKFRSRLMNPTLAVQTNVSILKKASRLLENTKNQHDLSNLNGKQKLLISSLRDAGYNLETIKEMKNFYGIWSCVFYISGREVGSLQVKVNPSLK